MIANLSGRGTEYPQRRLEKTRLSSQTPPEHFNLIDQDANLTLRAIELGNLRLEILPWIPLTHGADEEHIIEKWKLLALREADQNKRASYGSLALVFAEKAKCLDKWENALKGWNVEESTIFNKWVEQTAARCREEGRLIGLEEGRKNGLEEGEQIGIRNTLAIPLQIKFAKEEKALANELEQIHDITTLHKIQNALLTANSVHELRALLSSQ